MLDDVDYTAPFVDDETADRIEQETRPSLNRAQRRAVARGAKKNSPLEDLAGDLAPKAKEAVGGIANLLKGRAPQYTPVTKSLEQIGLEPTMGMVDLGNGPEQCMVIPIQQLVFKEWQHMTGSNYQPMPIGEINNGE